MPLGPFDAIILSVIDKIGIPSGLLHGDFFALVNAIIKHESSFNPLAVGVNGKDTGLMQINTDYWLQPFNITREDLFDPLTNINVGVTIIRDLINNYGVHGGLGAYNAGPNNRFSSKAQQYVNIVIGYWNSFKDILRRIVQPATRPGQFYFVDPGINWQVSPDVEFISLANPEHIEPDFDWTMVILAFLGFYILSDL